jgi:hypothetical protein
MVLLITRDDSSFFSATLRLQGRLEGPWGDRVEVECSALLGYFTEVVVDLSGVSGVDREGLRSLRRIHRRGVRLVGNDGTLHGLLEDEGIAVGRIAARTA